MSRSFKNSSLAIALLLSAAPLFTVHADAKASFMQECSAKWKAAKAAGTVADGTKWPDFMKAQCTAGSDQAVAPVTPAPTKKVATKKVKAVTPVNASSTDDTAVPDEPTNTSYSNIDVKAVDKNGKPFTSGQIAAHQRIKECAGEWRAAKTAGSLPNGAKWPQFWSSCNTRLKAQG